MREHPAIQSVAVVSIPDKVLGEHICACVQLAKGPHLRFEEIIAYFRGKGASVLQLPVRIEFIDSIPLISIGKTDKKVLREDIKKRIGMNENR